MTKAQHTPRPWHTGIWKGKLIGQRTGGIYVGEHDAVFDDKDMICSTGVGTGEDASISAANARLISAAPELLEVCIAARAAIGRIDPNDHSDWPVLSQQLDAAIAKAKGLAV